MAGMWITRLGIKGHEMKGESNSPSQVMLKREIWSSLPEDVLDKVLARLPFQSLVRMQSVCKKWKIKIRSPTFIRLCEGASQVARTEWFLTFGQCQKSSGTVCFAYDVHLSRWHTIPLGFPPFDLSNRSPLAAADGLICLGAGWNAHSRGAMPTKLVICNPVSRFWRDVPLPPQLEPALSVLIVAGLAVERFSGAYKVIVVGEVRREGEDGREVKRLVAYIFDSVSQMWNSYEVELDPLDSFSSFLASHFRAFVGQSIRAVLCSVACEEILYCLTARPYQLHAFNVVHKEWNRLKISLPSEISGPNLVARAGRLFLVGAYRHNQHDKGDNIGIWELHHDSRRWNVVDILLEAMRSKSNHGSKSPPISPPLAIKENLDDDVILFVKWATQFLAYNVSRKSWMWLPACILSAQGSQPSHNGYLFMPSLLLP